MYFIICMLSFGPASSYLDPYRCLLDGSAGNEEPFVIYAVNGCRPQVLMRLDVQRTGIHAVVRMGNGDICSVHSVSKPYLFIANTVDRLQRDATRLSFASDQFLPSFRTFTYNVGSILLVLALA